MTFPVDAYRPRFRLAIHVRWSSSHRRILRPQLPYRVIFLTTLMLVTHLLTAFVFQQARLYECQGVPTLQLHANHVRAFTMSFAVLYPKTNFGSRSASWSRDLHPLLSCDTSIPLLSSPSMELDVFFSRWSPPSPEEELDSLPSILSSSSSQCKFF